MRAGFGRQVHLDATPISSPWRTELQAGTAHLLHVLVLVLLPLSQFRTQLLTKEGRTVGNAGGQRVIPRLFLEQGIDNLKLALAAEI